MSLKLKNKSLRRVLAALALSIGATMTGPASARDGAVRFSSPEAALEQGLGAYRSGFHTIARQALGYAAERGSLLGRYYLARLYADPSSSLLDHARAYELLFSIVREHAARIDVDDDPRARYVGKSLTMLAGYWLRGLAAIGIAPNAERAAGYLQEAATFFRDQDAQFELAKLYLTGEGVPVDQRQAMHWLSTLSQAGHPGAQAFLADLYWRGKLLPRDEKQALALITLAVENAPVHERIWIEDTYQSIYCGMPASVRQQTQGLVASYRQRYSPQPGAEPQENLGSAASPVRTCADGTALPPVRRGEGSVDDIPPAVASRTAHPRGATELPGKTLQGGMIGIGARGLERR